jgi:hypothetical protein
MKPSPSEALPVASIPSFDYFLSQDTNPALAARGFLQAAREALADSFAPGKTIAPFLQQTSNVVDAVLTRLWLEYVGEQPAGDFDCRRWLRQRRVVPAV